MRIQTEPPYSRVESTRRLQAASFTCWGQENKFCLRNPRILLALVHKFYTSDFHFKSLRPNMTEKLFNGTLRIKQPSNQPYPTLPYSTLPLPTLPYPHPYPTLPFPTLPYPTLPYPTLPYPTLPYPTLPYPTLPYPSLA